MSNIKPLMYLLVILLVACNSGSDSSPLEPDSDGDGVVDSQDAFPNDINETLDTDDDGVGDNSDVFPNDANETLDSDNDGIGDNADAFSNHNAFVGRSAC